MPPRRKPRPKARRPRTRKAVARHGGFGMSEQSQFNLMKNIGKALFAFALPQIAFGKK